MHPVLLIDEILTIILSHMRIPNDRWNDKFFFSKIRGSRRTLVSLALTCRLLSEPALNLLWERQNSILPLLKVLPTFRKNENDAFSIVSPISPEHWARFQSYASRIQVFIYSSRRNIHPSVFSCLAQAKGDAPLLPCLRHIVWARSSAFGEEMVLFVSPTLTMADIGPFGYVGTMDDVESFDGNHGLEILLDSLANTAPDLEHLKVEGSLTPACTSSIAHFRHLRVLDLNACGSWSNIDAFRKLAMMDNLIELQINMQNLYVDGGEIPKPFPELQALQVSGVPSSIGSVFSSISSSHVHTIVVKGTYSCPPADWQPCFKILRSRFLGSLTEFRMKLLLGSLSMTKESEDVMQIVGPLLGISSLRVVALDLEGHLRVEDADIRTMALAWRELREFHLWCHKSGYGPSLQALSTCAALCKHLTVLQLPIDARQRRPSSLLVRFEATSDVTALQDPPSPSIDVVLPTMQRLTLLGNVGIDDPERVGSHIRGLFPKLLHFEAYAWDPSMNEKWSQVKRSLTSLRRPKQWVVRKPK